MNTDELRKHVTERLFAVWPEEMARETPAGLQWGQLIATAAVGAVERAQDELPWDLDRSHELLSDAGIPRVDDHGVPISLSVRVAFVLDESNSVRAELNELLESLAP